MACSVALRIRDIRHQRVSFLALEKAAMRRAHLSKDCGRSDTRLFPIAYDDTRSGLTKVSEALSMGPLPSEDQGSGLSVDLGCQTEWPL